MAHEWHDSSDDSQWKCRVTRERNARVLITGDLQCSVDGKSLTLSAKSGVLQLDATDISTLLRLSRCPVLSRRLNVRMNRVSRLLSFTSQRLDIYVAGVKVAAAGEGVKSLPISMIGIKNWRIWPFRIVRLFATMLPGT